MFNAVQKENQPLAERVAEQIAQLIQERELKEGDRLPNEFDLAQELGVGRGTIREAVKQLVARNILTIQRGKGTFVTQNPGIVEDPFGFNYEQDQQKLGLDLLEIRMGIEPWIAEQAARKATLEDIREIYDLCDRVERLICQDAPHLEEDIRFHVAIAQASKNIVVPKIIPVINRSVDMLIAMTHSALLQETIETHRAIADGIAAHDPEKAREAMQQHLKYNWDCIHQKLAQEEKDI